ncbi:MAG: hypothetical protein FWF68_09035 [Spirochaetes bacterium]|nr:hypothetical protein [Spirochaetota bacterium]
MQGKDFLAIRHLCLTAQGKALAVLSVVVLVYACFGMAASAIHANTAARALPCACKK